jgi:SAM-dependent MidA family methyltransferase
VVAHARHQADAVIPLRTLIADRIRAAGPISVAEYMRLALYHPAHGYYARASRRTGRAGDFFTSIDVGPAFGELLARQFAEMWDILDAGLPNPEPRTPNPESRPFHLVEAGAGSGRLARDVLDAAARCHTDFYGRVRLHLVEVSPTARAAQEDTLGPHAPLLASSAETLGRGVRGVIVANELLDALPTHTVVMREQGLRELFVDLADDPSGTAPFVEREMETSTPELARYLGRANVRLEPGWRAEINLEAVEWTRRAAAALDRGFLVIIDYGHEAAELYSAAHSAGTLTTFHRHTSGDSATLLQDPGEHDITAHVDLTTVTRTAEAAGLETLGRLDQTYFLLGLGLADMLAQASLKQRLALKTLMLPGGLGSTLKVLIFGKNVGTPKLRGLSYRERMT